MAYASPDAHLIFEKEVPLFDDDKHYVIAWLQAPKYTSSFVPQLVEGTWYQFTGDARTTYVCLQWIKSKVRDGIVLDFKINEKIDYRDLAEDTHHWHTINGKPDFHSWDSCPENNTKRK